VVAFIVIPSSVREWIRVPNISNANKHRNVKKTVFGNFDDVDTISRFILSHSIFSYRIAYRQSNNIIVTIEILSTKPIIDGLTIILKSVKNLNLNNLF
jgi:hypothetical protein